MPMPPKSRITRPRIVLPSALPVSTRPSAARSLPSSTTTGRLPLVAKSGSLLPSMISAWLMLGRAEATLIVCGPLPAMSKTILSGEPPLAVLLAAMIASRSEIKPSAPLLASSVDRLVVSPSLVSALVSTVIVACALDTAATLRANSEVSVQALKPALLLVAVALMKAPTGTLRASVALIVALPDASVVTLANPRYVCPWP